MPSTITLFFPLSNTFVCLFVSPFLCMPYARWEHIVSHTRYMYHSSSPMETDTSSCWAKTQKLCFNIIYSPYGALFIIVCILLNTLCMALDHHDMSYELEKVLKTFGYVSIRCCHYYYICVFLLSSFI